LALWENVRCLRITLALSSPSKSGSWIDPKWFALDTSRGIETPMSKLFMRGTVILSDHAVYVPAAWLFTRVWHAGRSRRTQVFLSTPFITGILTNLEKNAALLALLFQPALLLIDFGHFQYNSVMLGMSPWRVEKRMILTRN
jgi:alpha-1,3-glucosyltransferase